MSGRRDYSGRSEFSPAVPSSVSDDVESPDSSADASVDGSSIECDSG